jgi:hypothetical protein
MDGITPLNYVAGCRAKSKDGEKWRGKEMQTRTFTITTSSSYPLLASDVKYALEFKHNFGTNPPEITVKETVQVCKPVNGVHASWCPEGQKKAMLEKFDALIAYTYHHAKFLYSHTNWGTLVSEFRKELGGEEKPQIEE